MGDRAAASSLGAHSSGDSPSDSAGALPSPTGGRDSKTHRRTSLRDQSEVSVPLRAGLSEQQVHDLREVFGLFDQDGLGRVVPSAVREAAAEAGLDRANPEVWQMVSTLCSDEPVDFEQFMALVVEPLGDPSTEAGTTRILSLLSPDAANAGSVGPQDLRRIVDDLGLDISDDELATMLDKAGAGVDGRLGLASFSAIFNGEGSSSSRG